MEGGTPGIVFATRLGPRPVSRSPESLEGTGGGLCLALPKPHRLPSARRYRCNQTLLRRGSSHCYSQLGPGRLPSPSVPRSISLEHAQESSLFPKCHVHGGHSARSAPFSAFPPPEQVPASSGPSPTCLPSPPALWGLLTPAMLVGAFP